MKIFRTSVHFIAVTLSGVLAVNASAQTAPKNATAATSNNAMLRIVCDGTSNNAEVTINGIFKGECSVDVPVMEGSVRLRVVKQVDATRERVFEQEIRMAAGTVKRVEVELGSPQMTAKARREEDERVRQQQVLAAQRAAEEKKIELEREQREAAAAVAAKAAEIQAAALIQQKAEAGDVPSMVQLAEKASKIGEPASQSEANRWYTKAAELGDAKAMGALGAYHFYAAGTNKNDKLAEQWWRKGATAGDGRSMAGLSRLYAHGAGGVAKDSRLAQEWVLKSVAKESPQGLTLLYEYHLDGIAGFSKDKAEGMRALQRAAASGDAAALTAMGFDYQYAMTVPEDLRAAAEWYRKAADAGSARAMYHLGHFTQYGLGGLGGGASLAMPWYAKAAALDDELGLYMIGTLYLYGLGVDVSEQEALKWFRKSAATGGSSSDAKRQVGLLEAKGIR